MLRVIGIEDNGDLIIEKTSSLGGTEMQIEGMEKVYEILKRKQGEKDKQAQEEYIQKYRHLENEQAEEILFSTYSETVSKALTEIMEKLKQDLQPLMEAFKQIATLLTSSGADTMESIKEMIEAMRENAEENRIERERRRTYCRIERKGRIWQQARKTLKYRPYELRIYKIH